MPQKNIIFGTGQLGLAVMDELAAHGRQVTLVSRKGQVNEALPAGVQIIAGDATDPAQVAKICREAEAAFHCAQPPYTRWPELFPPVTEGIMKGAAKTQAKLVFADNLYMYGPTGGRPIHENLSYAATGPKGRTRAQMAETLLAAHRAGKIRAVIGRASDFYGPRVTSSALGERFFGAALTGKAADWIGRLDLPHTFTYIRDFAKALVTLSDQEKALGRAWHVPNAETLTMQEIIQLLEEEVGHSIKVRTAGRLMVNLIGLFNPMVREFRELMYEYEEPYIVDHSHFVTTFGNGVTPHQKAIRETVEWYRQHS